MTRLFGTNGIRGVVGKDMTAELAVRVGKAIGTHFEGGPVALARDTRLSGPMLSRAVASGLMAAGCEVVDLGVVPTPCAQYYVHSLGTLAGAVIITASHNPPEFNGIKAVDVHGMEMDRKEEEAIEAIYSDERYRTADWADVGSLRTDGSAIDRYLAGILSRVDAEAIRRRAFTVAADPGNGAGCVTTPYLLRALGCRVVSLNAQPDGAFPGRLPEPTQEHLGDLMLLVVQARADLGVAHDGDADRAIFVDEKGAFLHGDKSLALLARAELRHRGGLVVTPVSTSSMIDDVVKEAGGTVRRTKVGSPIVAHVMFENGAAFGGEENGGVIFPAHQFCRDGGMSLAKMLDFVAYEEKPLSTLVAALPQYSLHKEGLEVPIERHRAVLDAIVRLAKGRQVTTLDGVKIHEPDGWVLVRPSGTEPLFRVYAEARSAERAEALAKEGLDLVRKALKEG